MEGPGRQKPSFLRTSHAETKGGAGGGRHNLERGGGVHLASVRSPVTTRRRHKMSSKSGISLIGRPKTVISCSSVKSSPHSPKNCREASFEWRVVSDVECRGGHATIGSNRFALGKVKATFSASRFATRTLAPFQTSGTGPGRSCSSSSC